MTLVRRILAVIGLVACFTSAGIAAEPDFGLKVLVFDPSQTDIQQRINTVFKEQERAQFGSGRYALLFKPGQYRVDVPVGFYTQVAGLGKVPDDVAIQGDVWTDAAWMGRNATCNFWRGVENLSMTPTRAQGADVWAVSQGTHMRRVHIKGNLHLSSGGWASGGFLADSLVDGTVASGSQQQWFARNNRWKAWNGGVWNMVFVGTENPPRGTWPQRPFTVIPKTPVIREKPFLVVDDKDRWFVMVPDLKRETSGISWGKGPALTPNPSPTGRGEGVRVPIEKFYLAHPEKDTAATLNRALREGKNLLLTPGLYRLDESVVVSRPNTIVLGLGLPSLAPTSGKPALIVEAGEGVIVGGLLFDATPQETDTLVQIGRPGKSAGRAENPVCLYDLHCRVGGPGPGKAKCMMTIYTNHVIGENFWLWRADHGAGVGWTANTNATGLRVEGDNVTMYGLFVEHTQEYQTLWNGNAGRVYFYQSEFPYDPPSNQVWHDGNKMGWASYKVGDKVTTHEAWGLGVYNFIRRGATVTNPFEAPAGPGIQMHHLMTFGRGGGSRHFVDGTGVGVIDKGKAVLK